MKKFSKAEQALVDRLRAQQAREHLHESAATNDDVIVFDSLVGVAEREALQRQTLGRLKRRPSARSATKKSRLYGRS